MQDLLNFLKWDSTYRINQVESRTNQFVGQFHSRNIEVYVKIICRIELKFKQFDCNSIFFLFLHLLIVKQLFYQNIKIFTLYKNKTFSYFVYLSFSSIIVELVKLFKVGLRDLIGSISIPLFKTFLYIDGFLSII